MEDVLRKEKIKNKSKIKYVNKETIKVHKKGN
jgi:hypothetical protein